MYKIPKVIFVMGGPGFGKSTFIKNYLVKSKQKTKVIDLWDFQKHNKSILYYDSIDAIKQSYENCLQALLDAINSKKYDLIILEHTLLRQVRRSIYIKPLLELGIIPEIIVLYPEFEVIKQRWITRDIYIDDDEIYNVIDILEIPTCDEGFSKVIIINEGKDNSND